MAPMAESPQIDFDAAGLLEGVRGESRRARLALLEQLVSEGVSVTELREAIAAGRLTLLPVERALAGDGPRYTPREVAQISGVELALLQRSTVASEFPPPTPMGGLLARQIWRRRTG